MSPQLTLQTPLQLPPSEIPTYLEQLWSHDESGKQGANTFCLIIWQPAWIEQKLVKANKLTSPILGNQRTELIEAARKVILEKDLPHSTPPLDQSVQDSIEITTSNRNIEDLRGQNIDSSISDLQPRRLITLAPTIEKDCTLEALVAAYCPLPEEGGGDSACGDVVVLRGDQLSLTNGLKILGELTSKDLPQWLWWNGNIDDSTDILSKLATKNRRLIIDSALGDPDNCLKFLLGKIKTGQAVNDLNWLRLRTWRETLAIVFDPLHRRNALEHLINIDIDIEGTQTVQGLLLAAWLADRLNWEFKDSHYSGESIKATFIRSDKTNVNLRLNSLPIGNPSIHPGQIVGIRLISNPHNDPKKATCVILASESRECMRLEAGGMASMELVEQLVPAQKNSLEMDVAQLLSSSRGSSSPLLISAAPLARELLSQCKKNR